jgi:acyl-CoA synthetase (AMP-forming)/AMP-acid ligase II/acyl carrier protein
VTAPAGPAAHVVPDLLRARAAADPDGIAHRAGDAQALTYGEWEARSNAAGRGLVARGVRRGDRVALLLPNDRWVDHAVAYLAVLKAGAAAVPLGSRFAGPELEWVLAHADIAARIGPGHVDPHELEAGRAADPFQVPADPDDLAEIVYTSGTTGRPKGVACTHRGLLAHDLPATVAAAGPASFVHAFPIGTQAAQEALRVPLRIPGRTCIALPSFDADALCRLVERGQVANLQLVPAMAQVLVQSGATRRHDVSWVRRVVLSSSPAPPALFARLAEAFPRATLWNAYAATEAGAARTLMEWDERRPTAVGRAVGETELAVVDEAGAPLPAGEVGEVLLRRRGAPTRTYFRDPEATAEVFAGGWVHTGDVGYLDADGYLHLTDRSKDVIIAGGFNVSSVEVENALYEHPAVVDAAVVGAAHPVLGEEVAAAVVVRSATTTRELQDHVRARLAEHKVPHRMLLVDRLPRNASGKVLKGELRGWFAAETSAGEAGEPRDEVEAVVASVWAAVLGVARVGVDDDFFALGGHSLAAAQIVARLHDAFDVELPVAAVFESPTVGELAGAVRRAQAAAAPTR